MQSRLADVSFIRPSSKLRQHGRSVHGYSVQVGGSGYYYGRPPLQKLREYEFIALNDVTTNAILNTILQTLVSFLGEIEHPDQDIQNYLRYNFDVLNEFGVSHENAMVRAFFDVLWAGYSVTETLYFMDANRQLLIKDFATYHPTTIILRPDDRGRLVEGRKTRTGQTSGIFQQGLDVISEQRLPQWKVAYLAYRPLHGNYYGQSCIEPIYKWYLMGEAIADMMVTSLDRFGTPIVVVTAPVTNTEEEVIDPTTGERRTLTAQEIFEQQVNQYQLEGGNVLFLPYINPDTKPDAKTLTTGNNAGSTFINTLNFCDNQKCRALLMPFILLDASDGPSISEHATRQVELFHQMVRSLYRQFVLPWVSQTWHRLVLFAFDGRPSAKKPPYFPLRYTTRPEDRVAMMQLVNGLTSNGYFNPTDEQDWQMVRQWVAAVTRTMTDKDLEFVRQQVIYPKQKNQTQDGQERAGVPNTPRDRSKEGTVKSSPGRPTGTSSPQYAPREPSQ